MLVVKSPLRISFLGGGSDYPEFFTSTKGSVFGCSINLYVYVMALPLPPFAAEKIRFTYRKTESVSKISDLQHPVVREILRRYNYSQPINIATMADVSGNSGLGSSSSFTVGSLLLFRKFLKLPIDRESLASEAVDIERKVLLEEGGYQDQYFAAFGGLRKFEFNDFGVSNPNTVKNSTFLKTLEHHMLLIPFGGARNSNVFAKKHVSAIKDREVMNRIMDLVQLTDDVVRKIDKSPTESAVFDYFLSAVKKCWNIKVKNSTNNDLMTANQYINSAIEYGAVAGKLCGAGSSGFILLFCEPALQNSLLLKLGAKNYFRPKIDLLGARFVDNNLQDENLMNDTWDENRWSL